MKIRQLLTEKTVMFSFKYTGGDYYVFYYFFSAKKRLIPMNKVQCFNQFDHNTVIKGIARGPERSGGPRAV